MVDATGVRYHPDAYDGVLAGHDAAGREVIESTFGGLRFVRNQMGYYLDHADFIKPGPAAIASWTWAAARAGPHSRPALPAEWEITRYREYQARLAGHPVGETFRCAAAFLYRASESCLARP